MVFIRGHALDYENWRQLGCEGWSYSDVLPYFKKMESYAEKLPVLESDTKNIIEYIEQSNNKKKKKFNFWKLLESDE